MTENVLGTNFGQLLVSNSPQQTAGMTHLPFKPTTQSKSDWLATSLITARAVTAGAECLPFPYLKGVFGTAVVILETVEKVKKNRDDVKDLCGNIMEIIKIIQDQLSSHGETAAMRFKALCEDLEGVLQGILKAVKRLQTEPRGFKACLKEVVKLSSTTSEISGYRTMIQELRLNFLLMAAIDTNLQVHKSLSTGTSPNLPSTQVVPHINNCPPPTRIFHGRQTILDQMHQSFTQNLDKQDIFLLHGVGGAGKTQIVLKFIEKSASRFTDIFLIDTSTVQTIDVGLKSIATAKGVGDSSQAALQWLQSTKDEWLLFFDNADDPKINLNNYFPQCSHGNIIITSRNPGLRVYADAHCLVSDMEARDAVDLLLRGAAQGTTDDNKETAARIVKAGAFISKTGNLRGYLELFERNKFQLLAEKPAQTHDSYAWTVFTTWQISFDQLSEQAKKFLQLCSFLHFQGISEEIFKNATNYEFEPSGPTKEELQMPLKFLSYFLGPSGDWDPMCFVDLTNEIRAYSLINFESDKQIFSIHPLVHEWTRSTLSNEPYRHCIISIAGMSLTQVGEDIMLASLWMLPHLEFLIEGYSNVNPDFMHEFGKVYLMAGRPEKAVELELVVLKKWKDLLGEDHPRTLESIYWLAWAYNHLGKFKEAEELGAIVIEKRRENLGENHPDTLKALGNLVLVYNKIGKWKEAEELGVRLLEKRRNHVGESHPDTLRTMGNLALTYFQLGNWSKTQELELLVLEKRRAMLGDNHLETLKAMANLAATYHTLGRLQESETLKLGVLEKYRNILGNTHPDTLRAMGNLAVTYKALGKLDNAKELEVVVLEKRKTIRGDNHPDTLRAMGNLAATYNQLGRLQEAEELEIMVLQRRQNILGTEHPDTLRAMSSLGCTFNKLDKCQEAEKLLILAFKKQAELLSESHPHVVETRKNLEVTYTKLGKSKEAEASDVPHRKGQP
ncbi:hypothetical protein FB451DRAFT_1188696 [Mycena latifolia]|nr:hypothetical protein FB451DRAFT_1188696 [Mycena latifolia]